MFTLIATDKPEKKIRSIIENVNQYTLILL